MFLIFVQLFLLTGTGVVSYGESTESGLEYKLKAAFIFNFARLISWPESAFTSATQPFNMCVIGEDPLVAAFAGVEEKKIKGRKILLKKYSKISDAGQCHLMFVSSSEDGYLHTFLENHPAAAVVTVGESKGFAEKTGMIEFFKRDDDKLSFKINNGNAKQRHLYVEASLLDLAAEVY